MKTLKFLAILCLNSGIAQSTNVITDDINNTNSKIAGIIVNTLYPQVVTTPLNICSQQSYTTVYNKTPFDIEILGGSYPQNNDKDTANALYQTGIIKAGEKYKVASIGRVCIFGYPRYVEVSGLFISLPYVGSIVLLVKIDFGKTNTTSNLIDLAIRSSSDPDDTKYRGDKAYTGDNIVNASWGDGPTRTHRSVQFKKDSNIPTTPNLKLSKIFTVTFYSYFTAIYDDIWCEITYKETTVNVDPAKIRREERKIMMNTVNQSFFANVTNNTSTPIKYNGIDIQKDKTGNGPAHTFFSLPLAKEVEQVFPTNLIGFTIPPKAISKIFLADPQKVPSSIDVDMTIKLQASDLAMDIPFKLRGPQYITLADKELNAPLEQAKWSTDVTKPHVISFKNQDKNYKITCVIQESKIYLPDKFPDLFSDMKPEEYQGNKDLLYKTERALSIVIDEQQ